MSNSFYYVIVIAQVLVTVIIIVNGNFSGLSILQINLYDRLPLHYSLLFMEMWLKDTKLDALTFCKSETSELFKFKFDVGDYFWTVPLLPSTRDC